MIRSRLFVLQPFACKPLALGVVLALAGSSSIVTAQDSAAAAADPAAAPVAESDDAAPTTLDIITVTATRRAENAQDVPIAISTVSRERMQVAAAAGDDLRMLAARTPSLHVESSFGRTFPRFYLRGLGNTDFDLNASQPVSLLYDEIVQENPLLKGFPAFDLDRVEVLRGPQGTLFGRNTPAGVVKFESARPSETFGGYGRINYARFDTVNLEGVLTGPVGDGGWSARASVLVQRRGDWVDNAFSGEQDALEGYRDSAARLQLQYEPGGVFGALFKLHARSLDGTARVFRANIIEPGSNRFVDGFDPRSVAQDGPNEQTLDHLGGSMRLRWDFDTMTLHALTGYETLEAFSHGDIDGGFGAVFAPPSGPGLIPFSAESADGMPRHRQLTQEFRLESALGGAFRWQAGVFWFDESFDIETFNFDTLNGGIRNGYVRQTQENTASALFGSIEQDVGDAWTLRAGGRFTRDEKDFVVERFESPLAFLGAGPIGPIEVSPSASDFSWDLAATWHASDTLNLYGRVARGFRAPSIQGRLLFGDEVSVADSERVLSFELGIKAELLDQRARIEAALFDYRVDDMQLTAVGGDANISRILNADRARGRGAEFDFEALLSDSLRVTVGAGFNDTEIDDPNLAVLSCGAPCSVLDPAGPAPGTVLIDGNPLPMAPRWTGNFTAHWSRPVGDAGELYVDTDWIYRSRVSLFLYQSREFTGGSLVEGGLRVGFRWNDGRQELALFGRNVTDRVELVGGVDFNNLTGFINEPRIVGVEFRSRL